MAFIINNGIDFDETISRDLEESNNTILKLLEKCDESFDIRKQRKDKFITIVNEKIDKMTDEQIDKLTEWFEDLQ